MKIHKPQSLKPKKMLNLNPNPNPFPNMNSNPNPIINISSEL